MYSGGHRAGKSSLSDLPPGCRPREVASCNTRGTRERQGTRMADLDEMTRFRQAPAVVPID